ncbi:uncharacterized protein B0T15DRAFT_187180 [Chaetomium strumarium]|uniref:Uncharacterized protein n=1 Tax=Chaetomium strumarium TaxID=1170767 RepID=A0AAJ0GRZ4_9PEZI|nr:hypothetical protein B0T15DRAFT_187180 [Chaetomium strumarium]
MAEQSEERSQGYSPSATEAAQNQYDLEICMHRHQILAVADLPDHEREEQSRPVPTMLYHWRPPTVRAITMVKVSPRLFSMIKGSSSLGTFFLQDDLNISETLYKLLTATHAAAGWEPTAQLLTDLVAQLPVPERGTLMEFFSFPVLSDNPEQPLGDSLFPVWKWVKPESIYPRKTGFWETHLHRALDDGEWNAGKGLTLALSGVPEQALQRITGSQRRLTSLRGLMGEASK